ncbi:hemagglutinin repeat-containing protein, partial [Stutzerimonas nitrititolerans]
MQANERLQLLATDSIRNAAGGIIAGRDVTALALTGDIINERSITTHEATLGSRYQDRQDFADNAARIEAGNDLQLSAGRDLLNVGGALSAGGDASLSAGRDLVIASQQEEDAYARKDRKSQTNQQVITQHASDVKIGGDLIMQADRDLAIIGSRVEAGGNMALAAGENLTIASAANESHYEHHRKSGGKKVDIIRDNVTQQSAELVAGGNFTAISGADTTIVSSTISAGNEAYLYAGGDLNLLAAQNSDYSLYDMKSKGSWGSKKTQRDEVTTVRNIGSTLTTGGDLTLASEGDQRYQNARLESGNDLTLDSGGAITFEAVKDLDQESHEKSKSGALWQSAKGKGTTDETVQQSVLIAKGETVIRAVEGLQIDIKHVDQKTVSQTIDAMVQADPELAWLKEMEQRGDV